MYRTLLGLEKGTLATLSGSAVNVEESGIAYYAYVSPCQWYQFSTDKKSGMVMFNFNVHGDMTTEQVIEF
jgi:hypothetical protein